MDPRYVKVVALYDKQLGQYVPIAGETPATLDADIDPANIKKGVNILGRVGTFTAIAAGDAAAAGSIAAGKKAYVNGTLVTGSYGGAGLAAGNIKAGVTIAGTLGTFTNDANAFAANIIAGKTAYVNGVKLTGTYNVSNLSAATVKHGVTFGITGSLVTGTFTDLEESVAAGTAHIANGRKAWVNGVEVTGSYGGAGLLSGNIKYGVTIAGVPGDYDYEETSPAEATDIILNKVAFVNGNKITGSLDLTNLEPENIKSGVTINGVLGTYTGA